MRKRLTSGVGYGRIISLPEGSKGAAITRPMTTAAVQLHHPKGGVYMPVTLTFHVKGFTVTITVKRTNRHPGR